jgi:menaquinone-dependent protoporphyrinogen IX oxidase
MDRKNFLRYGTIGLGLLAIPKNLWALKYYPKPSDKKCAVIYGTWCGSSRDAAVWISEGMGGIADVFDVREEPDLKGFDNIIIGGSIRMNATSKELQEFIIKNKEQLKSRVIGLFAVCGNMKQPVGPQQKTSLIDNHLAKLCEVQDVKSRVFLGRVTKSLMDPETSKMMGNMEDYDNLKRSECMVFGKELLQALK